MLVVSAGSRCTRFRSEHRRGETVLPPRTPAGLLQRVSKRPTPSPHLRRDAERRGPKSRGMLAPSRSKGRLTLHLLITFPRDFKHDIVLLGDLLPGIIVEGLRIWTPTGQGQKSGCHTALAYLCMNCQYCNEKISKYAKTCWDCRQVIRLMNENLANILKRHANKKQKITKV